MFEAVGFITCMPGMAHTSVKMIRQKITLEEGTRGWIVPMSSVRFNPLRRILFPREAKEKWVLAKEQLELAYAKTLEACPRFQRPG